MLLRDVLPDDLPILFEFQRDLEDARIAAIPSRDHDAFYTHWNSVVLPNVESTQKTVVVDGVVAGHVVAFDVNGKRMIGYWIGRAYAGRGIATAALKELLRDWETARPLYAAVSADHHASRRVLEKNGFVASGPPVLGED